MLRTLLFVVVAWGFLLTLTASAQKANVGQVAGQQAVQRQTEEIVPGQSVDEVVASLQRHGKEFGGRFQFNGRPGFDHFSLTLDADHVAAAVDYQLDTKRITGIAINLKASQQSPRGEQFWMSARKITLHPDGSYSIQFEPPVRPKPPAERPKNVYPTLDGNGQATPDKSRDDGRY